MEIAHIINSVVKGVYVFNKQPEHAPSEGFYLDVSNVVQRPGPGWTHIKDLTFERPPEVRNTVINNIDLWDRFLESEKEDLCNSANKTIKMFLYELRIRNYIDLLNPRLITIVNALETAGVIGTDRADAILTS